MRKGSNKPSHTLSFSIYFIPCREWGIQINGREHLSSLCEALGSIPSIERKHCRSIYQADGDDLIISQ